MADVRTQPGRKSAVFAAAGASRLNGVKRGQSVFAIREISLYVRGVRESAIERGRHRYPDLFHTSRYLTMDRR